MRFLGKTGEISSLMKNMRDVPPEQRPSMGKLLNALREWTEERFDAIEKRIKDFELKKKYKEEKIDVTLPGRVTEDGAYHPNTLIRNELISVFAGMGFEIFEGPEIENDYYNFTDEKQNGYAPFAGVYYEARFDSNMPDLNLDNPKVRGEISEVIEFWMKKGVDGFRLDACTSYYTNSKQKSVEFAGWIKEEAVKHNPDAYIVGEVWSDAGTINDFYGSGADS